MPSTMVYVQSRTPLMIVGVVGPEARHLSISFLPGIHLLGHDMLPTLQVWNYMQAMASVAPGSGLGALQKFPIDFLMEVPFAK